MQCYLLDPTKSDEFYTPFRSYINGRRGICKYEYLSKIFEGREVCIIFSGFVSGMVPGGFLKYLPNAIKNLVFNIECFLWGVINNIKPRQGVVVKGDVIIACLRNVNEASALFINEKRNEGVIIVWNLSHIHSCLSKLLYIDNSDIVLQDNYFPLDFNGVKIIAHPYVHPRFNNAVNWYDREDKIICVGTVHELTHPGDGFVEVEGKYTLHPSRYDVYKAEGIINNIITKKFSLITEEGPIYSKQKNYMSMDLVALYNNHKYAFIGAESSGVAPLGLYEAMACGCEVFVEKEVGLNCLLRDGENAWFFDGTANGLAERYFSICREERYLDKSKINQYENEHSTDSIKRNIRTEIELRSRG